MKKMLFILIIALLFGAQWIYRTEIHFFTLHDRGQRKMIASISDHYRILPGNIDEHLKIRRNALYKIHIIEHRECYVVFVQDIPKKEELIQLYDANSMEMLYSRSLLPYRIHDNEEVLFRSVMDLNLDGNLEIAVVVQSKAGKKLRIFSIHELRIQEIPLKMAENYTRIQIEDLNHDGSQEIIAQTSLNGLLQAPELFHYQQQSLVVLNLANFPRAIKHYEQYLEMMENQLPSQHGLFELQWIDIKLSRAMLYLALDRSDLFNEILEKIQADIASDLDPSKRLRYYRSRIYYAYSLLQENQQDFAAKVIENAIRELQETTHYRSIHEIESLILTELANYYRWKRDLETSQWHLRKAMAINPYNIIAKGYMESYFLDDA